MNKFQTPWDLNITEVIDSYEIKYENLTEVCQGGPEIGDLLINNRKVQTFKFGGPFLYQNDCLYIPAYTKKKFLGWGFRLVRIEITKLSLDFIGDIQDLIYLDKIENGKIYYYTEIDKRQSRCYEL